MPTPINQLLSRTIYITDGTTTFWDFSFSGGYLDSSHVKAYVTALDGSRTDIAGINLVGPYQIKVDPALASGGALVIYRDTPKDLPLVDFTDGSGFSELSLDTNAKQAVFIAAETLDALDSTPDATAAASALAAAGSALAAAGSAQAAELSAASVNTANLVNTSTNQTVSGTKTFSSPIQGSVTGSAGTAGTPFAQTLLATTTAAQARSTMGISAASGSADVGYTPAGIGAIASTVQTKLRESVSVLDFGASPAATATANVTAFQAAFDYANSIGGCKVIVPSGTYMLNAALNIYKKTILQGAGKNTSILSFSHTGNGIQSTWPINSSTGVWIGVRDLMIYNTNALNTGAGFVDVGGSFVDLYSAYIVGFKYEVIYDQTEVATIDNCTFESAIASGALIWLVDGADYSVGALAGYTNRITITRNQFNCGASVPWQLVIDGGGAHSVKDNNFNAGVSGIRAANSSALTFTGNEIEAHTTYPMLLTDTKLSGVYAGPVLAPTIDSNSFTDSGQGHIYLDAVSGGSVKNNSFAQASSGNIYLLNDVTNKAIGVVIEGNSKLVTGTYKQAAAFVVGNTAAMRRNVIRQKAVTYVVSSQASGAITVTPATMESISPAARLWCINADGTNGELVTVTSFTSSTFTATFATTKAANFLVYGAQNDDLGSGGVWTPSISGTGPVGGATMSVQNGSYSVTGSKCTLLGQVTWSALTGGAAGQLAINLPFVAKFSNQLIHCVVTGTMGSTNPVAALLTTAGSTSATLVSVVTGTGALTGTAISAAGVVYVSGTFDIG